MVNWYEQSFGDDYMVVYKNRDWDCAYKEVQRMAGWLNLPREASVLDVGCGMGRHALALSDLGYKVTGIDLSESLLQEARKRDDESQVEWVLGDMRQLPFDKNHFDAAVNLFTSFGYFNQDQDNIQVLKEIRRVLCPGAPFLIDFLNPAYVKEHLIAHSQRNDPDNGWTIHESRSITDEWVKKTIEVIASDDPIEIRHYYEQVRLYSLTWFEEQLERAGLILHQVFGNYDGAPYQESTSPRLIMTGRAIEQ
ncbi:MAG: class I SAM-dependent methyltransferase [Candidatus Pristimantibacillus sp.]